MFKSLLVYRLDKPLTNIIDLAELEFHGCAASERRSLGFIPVLGEFVRPIGQFGRVFQVRIEEKILPAAVVNQELEAKCKEVEQRENRRIGAKQKQQLKDELICRLLSSALKKHRDFYGVITDHFIAINTSRKSDAEATLNALRVCIGSLPVKRALTTTIDHLTQWAVDDTKRPFALGNNAVLSGDEGERITIKAGDLCSDEVQALLRESRTVTTMALLHQYDDNNAFPFTLHHDGRISGIKLPDTVSDGQDTDPNASLDAALWSALPLVTSLAQSLIAAIEPATSEETSKAA